MTEGLQKLIDQAWEDRNSVGPDTRGDIRSAVDGGSLSNIDPNLQRFSFNVPVESKRRFPTFRLDYNLTQKHRASFAYNYQKFTDFPDTLNGREASFPGFPVAAGQSSVRLGWAGTMRSTLGRNLVNEARLGYSGAPVTFFGRQTNANPLLARLARQVECPIHGVRIIRLPGHRFTGELTEAIEPARDAEGRIDIAGTMQIITSRVESWIREHPEQWLWQHRRWRPEDDRK